jgi:hypothetical protein
MREITSHVVNPANDKLKIEVTDAPGAGAANHRYEITGFDTATNPSLLGQGIEPKSKITILFQNGPINEHGVNGVTQEVLLAIVADRLECFQAGPFASDYNAKALEHVKAAQESLLQRTRDRMARGVEGRSVA